MAARAMPGLCETELRGPRSARQTWVNRVSLAMKCRCPLRLHKIDVDLLVDLPIGRRPAVIVSSEIDDRLSQFLGRHMPDEQASQYLQIWDLQV